MRAFRARRMRTRALMQSTRRTFSVRASCPVHHTLCTFSSTRHAVLCFFAQYHTLVVRSVMARAHFSGGAGDDSEEEEPQPKKKSRLRQADSDDSDDENKPGSDKEDKSEGEGRYHISQTSAFRCAGQAQLA